MTEHHVAGLRMGNHARGTGHDHTRTQTRIEGRFITWWRCALSPIPGGPCPDSHIKAPPAIPPCKNNHDGKYRVASTFGWSQCSECHRQANRDHSARRKEKAANAANG